jgi:hypothetical protein
VDAAFLRFLHDLSRMFRWILRVQLACLVLGLGVTVLGGWLIVREVRTLAQMQQESQRLLRDTLILTNDLLRRPPAPEALPPPRHRRP